MSVKRWEFKLVLRPGLVWGQTLEADMVESEHGAYVNYDDYLSALRERDDEIARLREHLADADNFADRRWRGRLASLQSELEAKQHVVDQLMDPIVRAKMLEPPSPIIIQLPKNEE